jgi:hypothetical protein
MTIFRTLLARDPMRGGWLIFLPIGLLLLMLAVAPSTERVLALTAVFVVVGGE